MFLAADGQDGIGLQLEKVRSTISSSSVKQQKQENPMTQSLYVGFLEAAIEFSTENPFDCKQDLKLR